MSNYLLERKEKTEKKNPIYTAIVSVLTPNKHTMAECRRLRTIEFKVHRMNKKKWVWMKEFKTHTEFVKSQMKAASFNIIISLYFVSFRFLLPFKCSATIV